MKLKQPSYRDIISGRDHSLDGRATRMLLSVLTVPYGLAVSMRNAAYHRGVFPVRGVSAPVISVGNLTAGGTGKTPTVAWLIDWLKERGFRPGIVSRGYRSSGSAGNDEKRLLDRLCPNVPHFQGRRRFETAERLLAETDTNIIVLDDGFQHRALHRDLDLVLIDAVDPWGFDRLLPRGLLRERVNQLRRADIVFLTRCDSVRESQISKALKRIRRVTDAPVIRTAFEPSGLINCNGDRAAIEDVKQKQIAAFCGIGNPEGFFRTLNRVDCPVSRGAFRAFQDHQEYGASELDDIYRMAERCEAEVLLTTAKDLVKIPLAKLGERPLWAVDVELVPLDSVEPLEAMIALLDRNQLNSPQYRPVREQESVEV